MTAGPHPRFRYVPYTDLAGTPNVIVDGSTADGTVLTLSHWPHTPVPAGLEADLSAEMAFTFLARPDLHDGTAVVSNNHFDQDGLVSVFALVEPEVALERRAFLIDVAAAGDFATYRDRDAARVSMVIGAFADPERSPLAVDGDDYRDRCAFLYEELLGRLPEVCDHPDRYREFWADEDATLDASEAQMRSGAVRIDEVPELDLTVLHVPADAPTRGGHRFGGQWVRGLHPMAIHNAVRGLALLVVRDEWCEFTYRYESWVQYQTRRPRPRVDLRPLAEDLTAQETSGGRWIFEGVETLTPRLYLLGADHTSLSLTHLRGQLEAALAQSPPAWDPYRSTG